MESRALSELLVSYLHAEIDDDWPESWQEERYWDFVDLELHDAPPSGPPGPEHFISSYYHVHPDEPCLLRIYEARYNLETGGNEWELPVTIRLSNRWTTTKHGTQYKLGPNGVRQRVPNNNPGYF